MNSFFRATMFFQTEAVHEPLVDLYETMRDLVFEIDLPGIKPENVLIKVYDDMLIIEGIREEPVECRKVKYICMERSFQSFRRILRMPVPVNTSGGRAMYSNGVLTLTFPKLGDKVVKIKIEKE